MKVIKLTKSKKKKKSNLYYHWTLPNIWDIMRPLDSKWNESEIEYIVKEIVTQSNWAIVLVDPIVDTNI